MFSWYLCKSKFECRASNRALIQCCVKSFTYAKDLLPLPIPTFSTQERMKIRHDRGPVARKITISAPEQQNNVSITDNWRWNRTWLIAAAELWGLWGYLMTLEQCPGHRQPWNTLWTVVSVPLCTWQDTVLETVYWHQFLKYTWNRFHTYC